MNSFKLIKYYKKFGLIGFYFKFFKDYIIFFNHKFKKKKNEAKWHFSLASSELGLSESYRIIESPENNRKASKASKDKIKEDFDLYPLM